MSVVANVLLFRFLLFLSSMWNFGPQQLVGGVSFYCLSLRCDKSLDALWLSGCGIALLPFLLTLLELRWLHSSKGIVSNQLLARGPRIRQASPDKRPLQPVMTGILACAVPTQIAPFGIPKRSRSWPMKVTRRPERELSKFQWEFDRRLVLLKMRRRKVRRWSEISLIAKHERTLFQIWITNRKWIANGEMWTKSDDKDNVWRKWTRTMDTVSVSDSRSIK